MSEQVSTLLKLLEQVGNLRETEPFKMTPIGLLRDDLVQPIQARPECRVPRQKVRRDCLRYVPEGFAQKTLNPRLEVSPEQHHECCSRGWSIPFGDVEETVFVRERSFPLALEHF